MSKQIWTCVKIISVVEKRRDLTPDRRSTKGPVLSFDKSYEQERRTYHTLSSLRKVFTPDTLNPKGWSEESATLAKREPSNHQEK
jgi:hypothetical protein